MEWEAKEELLSSVKEDLREIEVNEGYINSLSIDDIHYIEEEDCIYLYRIRDDYNYDGLRIEKELLYD